MDICTNRRLLQISNGNDRSMLLLFAVLLMAYCQRQTSAKKIHCGYKKDIGLRSIEYYDKVLDDCQSCKNLCAPREYTSVYQCRKLCREYYRYFISDTGLTTEGGIVTHPTSLDENLVDCYRDVTSDIGITTEGGIVNPPTILAEDITNIIILISVIACLFAIAMTIALGYARRTVCSEKCTEPDMESGYLTGSCQPVTLCRSTISIHSIDTGIAESGHHCDLRHLVTSGYPNEPDHPNELVHQNKTNCSNESGHYNTPGHPNEAGHSHADEQAHLNDPIHSNEPTLPYEPSHLAELHCPGKSSHPVEKGQPNEPIYLNEQGNLAESSHLIEPCCTFTSMALSTRLEEPVPSLLPPSTGEMFPGKSSCNRHPQCYTDHNRSLQDTDHETPLKQLHYSGDIDHAETANQHHQRVQDIHPLIQELNPICPFIQLPDIISSRHDNSVSCNSVNPEASGTAPNSAASNGEMLVDVSRDTPMSSGTEINSTLNEESFVNYNHDNPVIIDAEQSLLDQDNYQLSSANSPSATEQFTVSLHEDQPGIQGMLRILQLRNFHNMAGHVRYDHESISLNYGSYNGPSFSMPSSAGVQISLNEEEDHVHAQRNVGDESPTTQPDDTELRYLHTKVYT